MKWIFIVLAALVLPAGIAFAVGSVVPRQHQVTRSATYAQDADAVWKAITSFREFPTWRSGIDSVRELDSAGHGGWIERSGSDELPLEIVDQEPGTRLMLRIASSDLPFGGTWTYILEPAGERTRLTITEDGHVDNALFRFMARFVFGYAKTLEDYLRDLGMKFGEEVTVTASPGR